MCYTDSQPFFLYVEVKLSRTWLLRACATGKVTQQNPTVYWRRHHAFHFDWFKICCNTTLWHITVRVPMPARIRRIIALSVLYKWCCLLLLDSANDSWRQVLFLTSYHWQLQHTIAEPRYCGPKTTALSSSIHVALSSPHVEISLLLFASTTLSRRRLASARYDRVRHTIYCTTVPQIVVCAATLPVCPFYPLPLLFAGSAPFATGRVQRPA